MPLQDFQGQSLSRIYRPRMAARLIVPAAGSTLRRAQQMQGTEAVTIEVRVMRATLVRNDHNHADELHFTAEYIDCGVDPRFLKNATVYFWIEALAEGQNEINLQIVEPRFVGTVIRVERSAKFEEGFVVEFAAQDYTQLFLASKPFPSDGVPGFDLGLKDAWAKICDFTGWYDKSSNKIVSTVSVLRDRLVFAGSEEAIAKLGTIKIGDSVSTRLRTLGTVPTHLGEQMSNAWDIWQHICQMLGLISFIDGDTCVVTTTTERYSNDDAPAMIWGSNISEMSEACNTQINDRGICLTAFDPVTGKVLESFYPPAGDRRVFVKRNIARRKNYSATDQLPVSDQYDYYEMNGITNQDYLDRTAKSAYEERARQEIEGTIKTSEIHVTDGSGNLFNLLAIQAGDSIKVAMSDFDKELLTNQFTDQSSRINYLLSLGYSFSAAEIIAQSFDAVPSMGNTFHVKQVQIDFDNEKFEIEIRYHNLINLQTSLGDDTSDD